ncbi:hypothetical protein CGMCC3_g9951 [Colletotrichum fructicola]|uniref:Zn(2)-C6 fungal-type domain-containing protein n=1 Tax=Colletotrichum fructicola (strain Nara gc5) TaxID=1213859 RepID=A0A7J6IYS5_COLFN|nr:uncharacterized protein CGMCC3_g9951 [Colletotrichum fructicola]KAE9573948.1 hypothetical protein CGMCC3_g9951 [Colletotrichum fructicola]KAF4481899.1 hypothetical protein CGGC5_v009001 [Colletotrichum fructicola Nara gc5]KAF4883533.1 hypothetical protein CGCFRS4_v013489 [Colletotrichum fructicola]
MPVRRGLGVKRGCELCRAAHSKCDRKKPRCGRCKRLNRDCAQGPAYRFLSDTRDPEEEAASALEFPPEQIWVEMPSEVEFVLDATDDDCSITSRLDIDGTMASTVMTEPSSNSSPDSHATTPHDTTSRSTTPRGVAPTIPHLTITHATSPSVTSPHVSGSYLGGEDSATPFDNGCDRQSNFEHRGGVSDSTPYDLPQDSATTRSRYTLSALYRDPQMSQASNAWNLSNSDEPTLIRYFVTDLSRFFDYCDPERSFSTTVVQRAVGCPTLLLAILATSSRHLSLTTGYDSYIGDRYHRECLFLLIPMLDDRRTLLDESICAATVILRLYEELSVPLLGQDTRSHLLGTHLFVLAQEYQTSGIRRAAFLVALRQEINVAFSTRKPTQLLTKCLGFRSVAELKNDWDWTIYIIVLCAELLNHCYCSPRDESAQSWTELSARAEDWLEKKPISFEPLQCRERNGSDRVFPDIWFLNDCHVAGHIYYLMCHILLTAYSPLYPRVGPERVKAMKLTDDIIRDNVGKICGIALSNTHTRPALFKACTVIMLCGDLFTDRVEQQALLDLLIKTEIDLAWPTASSQDYLKSTWSWN